MTTATHDSTTLSTMARNMLEHAVVKGDREDVYGAEAAYKHAEQLALGALQAATNDHEKMRAERISARITESFADFAQCHQLNAPTLERMGPLCQEHLNTLPATERDLMLKILNDTDRINEINREIAHIQHRLDHPRN